MLRYPILLVHGIGFRDSEIINYWGRIPKMLEASGNKVFYGNQDSNGTAEENGKFLKQKIEEILRETGAEKVNVIAHSKGGLDMRYTISTLGMGQYIASLTTMSTPHNGSKTMDKLFKLPKGIIKFVAKCSDIWMHLLGDKNLNAYQCFLAFSTKYAKEFNENNKNDPSVYYQSYAFVMKHCYSDMIVWFPSLVVKLCEGENDGLLTPEAVKWGEFKGIVRSNSLRGISHCDEVDMRRHRFTKKQGAGVSDIIEVYQEVLTTLMAKGF